MLITMSQKAQDCLLTMVLCSTRYAMMCTSAGSWNRRQQNAMTQCPHCWWLLHLLFQRRLYRTWNRKNMKTTKISSYSYYQSTHTVGNKNHNTASSWSNFCALIVAQFGPHSWWKDICGLVTKKILFKLCAKLPKGERRYLTHTNCKAVFFVL